MHCYLCDSTNNIKVAGKVRDILDLKIIKCQNCGLVFLENFDHINETYYNESRMMLDQGFSIEKWIEEVEKDIVYRIDLVKPLATSKSYLDFGCGSGQLLKALRYNAYNCAGVEKSYELRHYLKFEHGLKVFADIKDIKEEWYDIITMFHVLEHLKDPKQTLKDLGKLLNPRGRILIETPNVNDALLTLYKNKAFSEFTYWSCHLYLFNPYTLKKLIEDIGLEVEYIKQVQKYPLSNHLYWLSKGLPNGHNIWNFMDAFSLTKEYEATLSKLGYCDTLLASIKLCK